jgi:hypothetical protein
MGPPDEDLIRVEGFHRKVVAVCLGAAMAIAAQQTSEYALAFHSQSHEGR